MIDGLRKWWQEKTGEEETPFDGEAPVWLISMLFHLVLMFVLAFVTINYKEPQLTLIVQVPVEEELEEFELPQEIYFNQQPQQNIGANSSNSSEMAFSEAPIVDLISEVPSPVELQPTDVPQIEIQNMIQIATGLHQNDNLAVRGAAGVGETGAVGAVDRITHEIILSLEQRKTLVVWLFDQSGSLTRQRSMIRERFERIYDELGVIEAAGNPAFSKHDDKPLLTAVVAFGNNVTLVTPKPTDNINEIQEAIANIPQDDSGVERVFSAVSMTLEKFRGLRTPDPKTKQPERNVMIVVFTDEVGDDQEQGLEETVKLSRRYTVPVYVVGVPAPFGRSETLVKWVDPDPNYDQTPQWGRVNQGPESYLPERIRLTSPGDIDADEPIDSGFGPYSLTRLAYETGGIYFAVHPNRNVNRAVSRGEIEEFSAHLKYFFDPSVMRNYRPDYVSKDEYVRRVSQNKARMALIQAAQRSPTSTMDAPQLRFVKTDEAAFVNALSEAQKTAAKLEPKIEELYQILKLGEADREKENVLRWEAGYDLAMGKVMAAKARTEGYNGMLALAKRGLNFKDPQSNTWVLEPSDEVSLGSQMEKVAEKAKEYLQRVVDEHSGTPWAMLAQRELDQKMSWQWTEQFTDPAPRGEGGGGNAPPPSDDKAKMLKKPAPKRSVPPL
jgi:hypothetical protein